MVPPGATLAQNMPPEPLDNMPPEPLDIMEKKIYLATHSLAGRVKYVILLFQDFIEPHL